MDFVNIYDNLDLSFKDLLNYLKNSITIFKYQNTDNLSDYIMNIVGYLLSFIFIITVIIFIRAGITILISAGDEAKVEKAKKIMIYCVFGVIIIFLAYPITRFILSLFIEDYR